MLGGVEAQLVGLARLPDGPDQLGREAVETGLADDLLEESHGVDLDRGPGRSSRGLRTTPRS
jgi:hypothetical protein